MKKFLFKIFSFLLLLLVIVTVLQLFISAKIKNEVLYGSDNLKAVVGQNNDLVCLGDSRCYNHMDPKFLFDSLGIKTVNLAIEGHEDLVMPTLRLKYYLACNPAPKAVVMCFDPFMNAGTTFNKQEKYTHKDYFSRYAFWPNKEDNEILDYFHFNALEEYVPLYALLKYQLFFKAILPHKKTIWETNGVAINKNVWDTVTHSYADATLAAQHTYTAFSMYYDSIKNDLHKLDDLCKQHNVKLVCIQMPLFKGIYLKESAALVAKMCSELGIREINVDNDEIIRDPGNFADPHHLNYRGVALTLNVIAKNKIFLEALGR